MLNLPEKVYALIWESKFAGDVPGPRILEASFVREDLEGKENDSTYDGVYMSSDGTIRIYELKQPSMVRKLIGKGADICVSNEYFVGCWFNGKPWDKIWDDYKTEWDWPIDVYRYLEACRLASGYPNLYEGD